MDPPASAKAYGLKTFVLQEKFTMNFEIDGLEVQERYVVDDDRIVGTIAFDNKVSNYCTIGQTINLPCRWCAKFTCGAHHAGVSLMLDNCFENDVPYVFCGFRINIVDKDGDVLYRRDWRSWENPRKLSVGEEHSMPDFISLPELLSNQTFLIRSRMLRLKCEGVLYSNFVHEKISTVDKPVLPDSVTKLSQKLWENGMQLADFRLESASGKPVLAHKLVMKHASEIWNKVIETLETSFVSGKISKCSMENVSESDVKKMIQYIYTGKVDLEDWTQYDQVFRLIDISSAYELRGLKQLCLQKVAKTMSLELFPQALVKFQKYLSEPYFREMLNDFLIKNQNTLTQMESFQQVSKLNKELFLEVLLG